jgi:nitroreductase
VSVGFDRPALPVHRIPSGAEHAAGGEALGLGATLTTLYLQFEKEAEAALGYPPSVYSYALIPIGYPMGRFGPARRVALSDVVYEDRWDQTYRDL